MRRPTHRGRRPARRSGRASGEHGPVLRGEPLGAGVGRPADALERRAGGVADVGRGAGRERQRAGERLAAVGEARRARARASSGGGAGARRRISDERRLHVRLRVEDRRAAPGAGSAPRRRAGRAPRSRRSSCCRARRARRSATSRWTIATQSAASGQLGDRLQQHGGRHAVGQVRHDLVGRRVERGEVELRPRRRDGASRSRTARAPRASGGSSERSTSTTCRCDTRGARYSDSTPSPPPTSSTTSSGASSAARPITPRMLSSIRKFWPSSRFGPDLEAPQAPRLAWRGSSLTSRTPARRSPRRCARAPRRRRRAARRRWRAVCATLAGSFGLPRTGWGER